MVLTAIWSITDQPVFARGLFLVSLCRWQCWRSAMFRPWREKAQPQAHDQAQEYGLDAGWDRLVEHNLGQDNPLIVAG